MLLVVCGFVFIARFNSEYYDDGVRFYFVLVSCSIYSRFLIGFVEGREGGREKVSSGGLSFELK